jgi:hypothetical protein
MNIGDEIALRVRVPRSRPIGHIRRQTFRRCQARTLADEQNDNGRVEQLADIIEHTDPAVANDKRPAE